MGLVASCLLGLFLLLGAGISFIIKNNRSFIYFALAFALGVLLSLIVVDIWPEAYEQLGRNHPFYFGLSIIIGVVFLKIMDLFIPDHHDNLYDDHHNDANLYHIGFIASVAIILHNTIEGMTIYSAFITSSSMAFMLSLGVGLHNIPLGMILASAFNEKYQNKKKTCIIIGGIALSTFLGGFLLFLLGENSLNNLFLGVLLAITLGMLLYICCFELLPKLWHKKKWPIKLFGLLLGILLITLTAII